MLWDGQEELEGVPGSSAAAVSQSLTTMRSRTFDKSRTVRTSFGKEVFNGNQENGCCFQLHDAAGGGFKDASDGKHDKKQFTWNNILKFSIQNTGLYL